MPAQPGQKNHYVPSSYLRGWVGGDGKLDIWNLQTRRRVHKSPRRIAFKVGWHDVVVGGRCTAEFEDMFTGIEDKGMRRLRTRAHEHISAVVTSVEVEPLEDVWLASLIAAQWLRGKGARSHRRSLWLAQISPAVAAKYGKSVEGFVDEDLQPASLAKLCEEAPRVALAFLQMDWYLLDLPGVLWTSDEPVTVGATAETGPLEADRIREVAFALTPDRALVLVGSGLPIVGRTSADLAARLNSRLLLMAHEELYLRPSMADPLLAYEEFPAVLI